MNYSDPTGYFTLSTPRKSVTRVTDSFRRGIFSRTISCTLNIGNHNVSVDVFTGEFYNFLWNDRLYSLASAILLYYSLYYGRSMPHRTLQGVYRELYAHYIIYIGASKALSALNILYTFKKNHPTYVSLKSVLDFLILHTRTADIDCILTKTSLHDWVFFEYANALTLISKYIIKGDFVSIKKLFWG